MDVDHAGTTVWLGSALEQVEEDIGAELVHAARLGGRPQTPGDLVDSAGDGGHSMRGEIEPEQVGGAVGSGFGHHSPAGNRPPISVGGLFRISVEAEPPDAGHELAGGEPWCLVDDLVDDVLGGGSGEVAGGVDDGPGPTRIDLTAGQELPHPGEAASEVEGEAQFGVGGAAGQSQGGADFGSSGLGCELDVVVDV